MKQVTITMTFDSMEALTEYLVSNPAAATEKVASAQPSADVVQMPAPAPAPAPITAPPSPGADITPAPAAEEVDLTALRSELMGKVQALAESDKEKIPAIAQVIQSFGVPKFSELADDQLVAFETAFRENFGV